MTRGENGVKRELEDNLAIVRGRHHSVADPLKYIMVDPNAITHHCTYHMRTRRSGGQKLDDWGKITDGVWDRERPRKLQTHLLTQQLAEHFIEGRPWEQCVVWERKIGKIREKGRIDGCRNKRELMERYQRLDRIYTEIRDQRHLSAADERGAPFTDDLFVSIARDGSFLFGHGGSHRLAIAQLLNLPSIPVRVLMRHSEWQRIRESFADGGHVDWTGHPDLADLLPRTGP